ncbi:MAG: galactokinase family protein, partial [Kiritimatiellae bacterium]|nr:galactokinase family protein [Kiritimatiellia bacterium]
MNKHVKNKRVIMSAPGTLMLMGEHAVLRGAPALACAVDQRIQVDLQCRRDGRLRIESALGTYE